MKKLVIVTHPDIENSTINKAWLSQLSAFTDQLHIHELYKLYPDLHIDIAKEQELLAAHEEIIFQFPVHWFNTPFFFKKWMDEVLTYGWAYGQGGDKLNGKKIRFAVSTGGTAETYAAMGNIEAVLKQLFISFQYCGCEVLPVHVFHGAGANPSEEELIVNGQLYANTILA